MAHRPLPRPAGLLAADSATVALQGAAGALSGQWIDPFAMPGWQRSLSSSLNRMLSPGQKLAVMRQVAKSTAGSTEQLERLDSLLIARWMVSLYPDQPWPGVILGAPSGAAAHLASLLGFPFLSQQVLCGLASRFPVDDTAGYVAACGPVVRKLLDRQPGFEAIIHHDPLHDRFLVGSIGFIRLKYRQVPWPVREMLQRTLAPGAPVVILDCGYPWLQSPLPEVHPAASLQVGGLGDVTPEQFLSDDPKLAEWRQRQGGPRTPWGMRPETARWQPESEWGTLPSFRDDAVAWATEAGFNPVVLPFDHPEQLTRWVLAGFRELWPAARRIYLDCFTHSLPAFNRAVQAWPLWLPFLTKDALRLARQLMADIPEDIEALISLHPSFADPADLATLAEWDAVLEGRDVTWLGVERGTWPADLGSYGRYLPALAEYYAAAGSPAINPQTLEWERFRELLG